MSRGDAANVTVWPDADVFVGPLAATIPTGGADFLLTGTDPWTFAGILDGSAGFGEDQSADEAKFFGWGAGVVATSNKNLSITKTFTAIEDNAVTLGLRYDVSGITFTAGGYSGDLAARDLAKKFRFGFQLKQGTTLLRKVTKNYAKISSLGTVTENEDGLPTLPVTVEVFPLVVSGKPVYWSTYKGAAA